MKTFIVSTSPKKRWSNSTYLATILKGFISGEVEFIKMRGQIDYKNISEQISMADNIVFVIPVYVDAVPAHVLSLLQYLEKTLHKEAQHCHCYIIANCGFYEGQHCELLLDMMKHWCKKVNINWCGGIGVGAGEMFGFIRVLPFVSLSVVLIGMALSLIDQFITRIWSFDVLLRSIHWVTPIIQCSLFVLFSMFIYIGVFQLSRSIRKQKVHICKYVTVGCPRFLFVVLGSIYWILRALFIHRVPIWRLFRKDNDIQDTNIL